LLLSREIGYHARMAKWKRSRKPAKDGRGRRPTGLQPGEKLSEYPRLTVRVPSDVRDDLKAVARRQERQEWRVLVDAIRAYCGPLLGDR
jgi:hypothetical protein